MTVAADIPPEAVRLALAARRRALIDRPDPIVLSDETLTRLMLEAAAPVLADTVAAKILAHMEQHEPKARLIGGKPAEDQRRQAWRRHFRIAARVASLAFSAREDILQAAADAIARGDVAVCDIPEVPREVREDEEP